MSNDLINIKLEGFTEVSAWLQDFPVAEIKKKAISDSALQFDNKARQLIQERIYDKPKSPNYVRTGRARAGSVIENLDGDGRKVMWDSRLKPRATRGVTGKTNANGKRIRSKKFQKEPEENYTPALDKNSRIHKLNTHFFTDAVEWIKEQSGRILDEAYNLLKDR